jgi:molybdate transport system regulatory protein
VTLEPQLKLAILEDNRFVFGDAEMRLLEAIGREGTLKEGAATLGLSYRVAWGKLRALEAAVGALLVERRVGGRGGGSSRLTDSGRKLVEQYGAFRASVGAFALDEFERCFGAGCKDVVAYSQPKAAEFRASQRLIQGQAAPRLAGEDS